MLNNLLIKVNNLIERNANIQNIKQDHRTFTADFNNKLTEIHFLNMQNNKQDKRK